MVGVQEKSLRFLRCMLSKIRREISGEYGG